MNPQKTALVSIELQNDVASRHPARAGRAHRGSTNAHPMNCAALIALESKTPAKA